MPAIAPVTANPVNNNQPVDNNPVQPPVQQAPKAVPGFDPAGLPLGDADVWNLFIGRGDTRRAVNTHDAHSKQKIDGREQKALLKLLTSNPKEFLQRLLADSMNGSPVSFSFVKEMKGFGIGRVDFTAENGQLSTTASMEVFNKAADGYLKSYLAKDPRAKGTRSKLAIEMSGSLNKEAGIDNIKIEARAENFPALNAEKLMEIEQTKKEIKTILEGKGRTREKRARIQELVGRAIENASEIPVQFLLGLITDNHELESTFKLKDRSSKLTAETGKGNYALTFTDLLDGENKDEADLGAKLGGKVSEDKKRIEINEARLYTTENLSIAWGEDDKPALFVTNAQGEKTKLDDHVGEIMMYLPMALALMGRGGPF